MSYQLKKLKKISNSPENFISVNEIDGKATINKDRSFIEYKSFEEKYFVKVNDIQVWLKPSAMFLLIGDIAQCSESEFFSVITKLQKLAFSMGIPHLRIQTSERSKLDGFAKKYFNKMEIEYPAGGVSFDENFDINSLNYVMADNDTF